MVRFGLTISAHTEAAMRRLSSDLVFLVCMAFAYGCTLALLLMLGSEYGGVASPALFSLATVAFAFLTVLLFRRRHRY